MPLYLGEDNVDAVLSPADAGAAVEACLERMARGAVATRPRYRLDLVDGRLAVMAAADVELGQDIVVTATSSPDPVLRGEWLRPGALVCAIGANDGRRRELDNVVVERAAFVWCDSVEGARLESGDLIEPVQAGVFDWLEVHELQEVVTGDLVGQADGEDIVLFKSNGLAAWDVAVAAAVLERARERGVGREL